VVAALPARRSRASDYDVTIAPMTIVCVYIATGHQVVGRQVKSQPRPKPKLKSRTTSARDHWRCAIFGGQPDKLDDFPAYSFRPLVTGSQRGRDHTGRPKIHHDHLAVKSDSRITFPCRVDLIRGSAIDPGSAPVSSIAESYVQAAPGGLHTAAVRRGGVATLRPDCARRLTVTAITRTTRVIKLFS